MGVTEPNSSGSQLWFKYVERIKLLQFLLQFLKKELSVSGKGSQVKSHFLRMNLYQCNDMFFSTRITKQNILFYFLYTLMNFFLVDWVFKF